jgi:hypothetical protein
MNTIQNTTANDYTATQRDEMKAASLPDSHSSCIEMETLRAVRVNLSTCLSPDEFTLHANGRVDRW